MTGVLCDMMTPVNMNGMLLKVVTRLEMMYGLERSPRGAAVRSIRNDSAEAFHGSANMLNEHVDIESGQEKVNI